MTEITKKKKGKFEIFLEGFRKAFKSNWSFVFFASFYFILLIIQYSLFATGIYIIDSNWTAWYPWFVIALTSVAGILSTFGSIMSARLNKNFFYFQFAGSILWAINSFFIFYWFNMFKIIVFFIPLVIRWIRWKDQKIDKITPRRLKISELLSILVMVGVLSWGLGYGWSAIDSDVTGNVRNVYIDSVNFVLSITCAFLIAYGFLEAWFLLIIPSIILFYLYISAAQWSTLSTAVIFLVLNMANGFTWLFAYYEKHETYKFVERKQILREVK